MGIADDLLGKTLSGRGQSPRQWLVVEKVGTTPGNSPGFFSVSYKVADSDGKQAFLKASDLSKVLSADPADIVGVLADATQAHKFERDILDHCRGNRMDRVVTAVDYGSEHVVYNGVTDALFFLVFELAEGDLRSRIQKRVNFDLTWIVSALHDYAVSVSQLHGGEVYHNDIKPANALVFSAGERKIADLGRATTPLMHVPHGQGVCVGDKRFAAPEQLYGTKDRPSDVYEYYRAGDLYNLGSLAHYLITGSSVTQNIITRLRPEFRPLSHGGGWSDTVDQMIPHWVHHLSDILDELRQMPEETWDSMAVEEFENIIEFISSMCEPNWRARGDRKFLGKPNQYNLARQISRFDLSRTKLVVRAKGAE
jgi:eukaryotic-like serine/threonine-protein kinase